MARLKIGSFYKCNNKHNGGEEFVGQYIGTDNSTECCVCGRGRKAKMFNVFYADGQWETWGFGACHMPTIIEETDEPKF